MDDKSFTNTLFQSIPTSFKSFNLMRVTAGICPSIISFAVFVHLSVVDTIILPAYLTGIPSI